jgi:hypothetical protein
MKHNQTSNHPRGLLLALGGVLCAALTGAAVWYDLTYNGGKLVYPMHSYAFAPADIPMLLAVALDVLYALYLAFLLVRGITAQKERVAKTGRTRRLSPKLGFLGFCGFLGFAGFWTYGALGDLSGFIFFAFFGFFGFFFEGKMSNTLMDERYKENAARAERKALRIGFGIIFFLLIFAGQAGRLTAELVAPILIAGIALAVALTIFLSEYLLYRYDYDDAAAMEEDG